MDEEEDEFIPLTTMPSSKLTDIYKILTTNKQLKVLNLDAILPPKETGYPVLRTLLELIPETLRVLSIRFNNLSTNSIEYLIKFIAKNEFIEVLYLMGAGIDDQFRLRMEESWKTNLIGHRYENLGYTFIRVTSQQKEQQEKEAGNN